MSRMFATRSSLPAAAATAVSSVSPESTTKASSFWEPDWWSPREGETFLHHSFPVFVWCSEVSFFHFWTFLGTRHKKNYISFFPFFWLVIDVFFCSLSEGISSQQQTKTVGEGERCTLYSELTLWQRHCSSIQFLVSLCFHTVQLPFLFSSILPFGFIRERRDSSHKQPNAILRLKANWDL